MQAKDMFIVAGIAVAAGATAGVAGSMLNGPDDAAARNADTAIVAQLDKIESRLAATLDEMKQTRTDLADIKDRVSAAEIAAREARHAASEDGRESAALAASDRPGRAKRAVLIGPGHREAGSVERLKWGQGDGQVVFSAGEGGDIGFDIGGPELQGEIGKAMQGITNSFRLRAIPEDKRWEKAREELSLTDGQIENLKRAVTERDEATKGAMQIESDTTDAGGSHITIRGMDPEKAAAADAAYRKRVDETLDENQRKGWNEKGYSNAFGKGGMGGAVSIIATEIKAESGAPKDPKPAK